MMRVLVAALGIMAPWPARADVRPTSPEPSVLSGRTLGVGQRVLAAGLGWPGIWASLSFAPSSRFNVALRATVLYGSPLMGIDSGVGGEIDVPLRLLVWTHGRVDLSLLLDPRLAIGEGALAGEGGAFGDNLAFVGQVRAGALLGVKTSERVTLIAGLDTGTAYADVQDVHRTPSQNWSLCLAGQLGIEGMMSGDTFLFAVLRSGYGFAPQRLFDGHGVIEVSLGTGYQL